MTTLATVFGLVAFAGLIMAIIHGFKKSGEDAQQVQDFKKEKDDVAKAQGVDNAIDSGADGSAAGQLRDKWTRH